MGAVPRHIGYILDGNRRWAKEHGLPTYEGHLAGYNALKDVIYATVEAGVEHISFYAFSTENWKRAKDEVDGLMRIIRMLFRSDVDDLHARGLHLVTMGDKERLPRDIVAMMEKAEKVSIDGKRATLAVCFNYGGQQEIVRAAKRAIAAGVDPDTLDNESFRQFLDHPEVPDCDLIVRTSGEQRLSNFMLWRSAYSEFIFLDKFWPDMKPEDVTAILEEYAARDRRHGG